MAVMFFTSAAQVLKAEFDARINQREAKGKITTWERSADGQYYTHKAAEWARKAWFKPVVLADRLTFHIVRSSDSNISTLSYAYYHGHLLETFLNHFDSLFSNGQATALPASGDKCSG
jgi:hypothetical protein